MEKLSRDIRKVVLFDRETLANMLDVMQDKPQVWASESHYIRCAVIEKNRKEKGVRSGN